MVYNISYERSMTKSSLNTKKFQQLVNRRPKHTKISLQLSIAS